MLILYDFSFVYNGPNKINLGLQGLHIGHFDLAIVCTYWFGLLLETIQVKLKAVQFRTFDLLQIYPELDMKHK